MAVSFTLAEESAQITLLAPAADAAGRTSGSGVSLKFAHKAYVIFLINQGNAATVLLTVQQCTNVAKAGAKAIPVVPIWRNLAEGTNSTLVRDTDAVNYTTDAGVAVKRVIFEIDPAKLDQANGFDCILAITGASNAANITAAEVLCLPIRGTGTGVPSLIAD